MHSPVDPPDAPAAAPRRVPLLAPQAAGVALALAAQFAVSVAPWFSLIGFAAAAALFVVAERLRPPPTEPPSATPQPSGSAFWFFFIGGVGACAVAAISVYGGGERVFNHLLWAAGLLLLAVSAFCAWRRSGTAVHDRRAALALAVVAALAAVLFFWNLTTMPP